VDRGNPAAFTLLPELLASETHVSERVNRGPEGNRKDQEGSRDLRKENHQLRVEKDDIAQAMGQIAAKLGIAPARAPSSARPVAITPGSPANSEAGGAAKGPNTRRPEGYARADLNVAADFVPASFRSPNTNRTSSPWPGPR